MAPAQQEPPEQVPLQVFPHEPQFDGLTLVFTHELPQQVFPAPQLVPSALLDQAEVLKAGLQIWQKFDGLVDPLPTSAPAIQQPLWHEPPLHTCPVPQLAPLALVVQEVSA